MVQGIMELLFDAAYLITAMTIGILLVRKGGTRFFRMFGIMAIVLASGDAFHLVPRVIALLTTGLEANAFRLGPGKLITSITMTGFYLILYFILEEEYRPDSKQKAVFRISLIALAAIRVILCAFPQNNWFTVEGSLPFGILRNIPFAVIGIEIIGNCEMTYHIRQNLISNAVRFVDRGGKITVRLKQEDCVACTVANTGVPLPKEEQPLIFQPFYRGTREDRAQGSGPGLAIVHKIVEKSGGKIGVETTEKETIFRVKL